MTKLLALLGLSLALPVAALADNHVTERRCGWVENPTPANYTLVDTDGDWRIAIQGGYQAEGIENLPEYDPSQFERTNGHYGRYCACLDVEVDYAPRIINYIAGGEAKPLAACQTGNFDEPVSKPAPAPAPAPKKPAPGKDWEDPSDYPYYPKDPKKGDGRDQRDQKDGRDQRDQKDGRDQRDQKDRDWDETYEPKLPRKADAEIQIFMDYRGYNKYAIKYVSNFDQVMSAGLVYPGQYASNAACYAGDPDAAIEVFQIMVDRMNAESGRAIRVNPTVFFDGGDTNKAALQVYAVDEYGQGFVWFDRIRKCDRWSTPEERANRPY